jgi:hypothetical protein
MVRKFYRQGRRCLKQHYSERLKQHPDCKCKTRREEFLVANSLTLCTLQFTRVKKVYREGRRCLKQYYSERLKQHLACKCKAWRQGFYSVQTY